MLRPWTLECAMLVDLDFQMDTVAQPVTKVPGHGERSNNST